MKNLQFFLATLTFASTALYNVISVKELVVSLFFTLIPQKTKEINLINDNKFLGTQADKHLNYCKNHFQSIYYANYLSQKKQFCEN